MDQHLRTQIGRLSGGQRRRVFLARALAAEPDLFLLDEPVTGIDPTTQELLMDLLEAQAARGKTVVATTHDLACAAQRFQQVLAVNRTVVAYGPSRHRPRRGVLARAYGGHLLVLGGRTMLIDDAHHHDDAAPGERHFHEQGSALMELLLEPLGSSIIQRALLASAHGRHRLCGRRDVCRPARASRSSATRSPTPGSRASSSPTWSAFRTTSAPPSRPSPRRSRSAW